MTAPTRPAAVALDPIDIRMLQLLAAGATHVKVAREIGSSQRATTVRLSRMYTRIGARNAAHAVAITIRAGLLPQEVTR